MEPDKDVYKKKPIRNRLKKVRKLLGLNQTEFGEPLGMNRKQIRDIEKGAVRLKRIHLLAMEHVYQINIKWMLTGRGKVFLKKD